MIWSGFKGVGPVLVLGICALAQLIPPTASDHKNPIPFFIAEGAPQSGYRASDRKLALLALKAWEKASGNNLRFQLVEESKALVRLYWVEPNAGLYGEMRPLVVGTRRGAAVYIQADLELLGSEVGHRAKEDGLLRDSIVYLTCLHELGHAFGLRHTNDFRDIMYFFGYGGDIPEYFNRYRSQLRSRNDISSVSGLSESDVARFKKLYGGDN